MNVGVVTFCLTFYLNLTPLNSFYRNETQSHSIKSKMNKYISIIESKITHIDDSLNNMFLGEIKVIMYLCFI